MLKFKLTDYLQEMAYPASFDMEEFKAINTFKKKLEYANIHLEKMASGSARTIFKIDDDKVLKVAKNKKGVAQNEVETDFFLQNYDSIAKIFDFDDEGFSFLEMELAEKLKPSRFKKLTGLTPQDIWDYLYNLKITYNLKGKSKYDQMREIKIENIEDNPLIEDLRDLILSYDMAVPGDLGRISSYGEVDRNGTPTVVIVDFGLSNGVFDDFYKKV